ncbi:hypothetical protein RA307_00195 [Xanthobacteraceae bacterium Astr-EGSB]|nr:hypothetical protein [Xanthobacteraceae bacterium Astr-EGSB]
MDRPFEHIDLTDLRRIATRVHQPFDPDLNPGADGILAGERVSEAAPGHE